MGGHPGAVVAYTGSTVALQHTRSNRPDYIIKTFYRLHNAPGAGSRGPNILPIFLTYQKIGKSTIFQGKHNYYFLKKSIILRHVRYF